LNQRIEVTRGMTEIQVNGTVTLNPATIRVLNEQHQGAWREVSGLKTTRYGDENTWEIEFESDDPKARLSLRLLLKLSS
jgi:hypothetical protein